MKGQMTCFQHVSTRPKLYSTQILSMLKIYSQRRPQIRSPQGQKALLQPVTRARGSNLLSLGHVVFQWDRFVWKYAAMLHPRKNQWCLKASFYQFKFPYIAGKIPYFDHLVAACLASPQPLAHAETTAKKASAVIAGPCWNVELSQWIWTVFKFGVWHGFSL